MKKKTKMQIDKSNDSNKDNNINKGVSKYNVSKNKIVCDGIVFDSKMEYDFYLYLIEQQKQGIVKNINPHPKYLLQQEYEKYGKKIRKIEYIADYEVQYYDGQEIIYDVKGFETIDFKIKRKIFDFLYPNKILKCISYSKIDNGWIELSDLQKNRKNRKKEKLLKKDITQNVK